MSAADNASRAQARETLRPVSIGSIEVATAGKKRKAASDHVLSLQSKEKGLKREKEVNKREQQLVRQEKKQLQAELELEAELEKLG